LAADVKMTFIRIVVLCSPLKFTDVSEVLAACIIRAIMEAAKTFECQ
jgi:hypothetical protein